MFGPNTTEALRAFQETQNLQVTGQLDASTLTQLVATPWRRPMACCGYLALVLDVAFIGMVRLVSVTSQFEGAGLFTALNRNTDKAGLSFGLIQWAQKPGRLNLLLRAFQSRQPSLFVAIFGAGDPVLAQALIAHTAKPRGGTDDQGNTIDPGFDLIRHPWDNRFIDAGMHPDLQRLQIDTAVADFARSFARLQVLAPEIQSERGIAFVLDVANQHGDGGADSILRKVRSPGMSEAALLAAIEAESVARVTAQFGPGSNEAQSTRNRREAFRTSALLSDGPLVI
jgi:peptidoglycan hydrolase-like protein with peptidoglycan-binding domain